MTGSSHIQQSGGLPGQRPFHSRLLDDPGERTTLKWASNGELSELDHQRILRRLCAADPSVSQLLCDEGSRD